MTPSTVPPTATVADCFVSARPLSRNERATVANSPPGIQAKPPAWNASSVSTSPR